MKKLILCLVVPIALYGCNDTFEKPNGTPSSKFDGVWHLYWVVSEANQEHNGTEFICKTESRVTMMFIEDGWFGTPDVGPRLGMVDSRGIMFGRFQAGDSFMGDEVEPAERIISARLQDKTGSGFNLFVRKGSNAGCYGEATFTKFPLNSFPGISSKIIQMESTAAHDGVQLPSASLTTTPPSSETGDYLKLQLGERPCYGWWAHNEDLKTGVWHAYCGNQQKVSGDWSVDGNILKYEGTFIDGTNLIVNSQLP